MPLRNAVRQWGNVGGLVAGLFLVGVGFAHLRQTGWVVDSVNWVVGLFTYASMRDGGERVTYVAASF